MDLNTALELDFANGADMLKDLDTIAYQLSLLGIRYPNAFSYLCHEGRMGADFTLVDAASAVADACDHLAEGE